MKPLLLYNKASLFLASANQGSNSPQLDLLKVEIRQKGQQHMLQQDEIDFYEFSPFYIKRFR